MLSRLVREHNQKQQAVRRNNEQLRKEAVQAVSEVTDSLADTLNERVSTILKTQREIESEARKLSSQSVKYTKQTKQWLSMLEGFNSALKELGDVQNWAEVIEKDMREIATTLEFVHKGLLKSYFILISLEFVIKNFISFRNDRGPDDNCGNIDGIGRQ
ncbi:biogenesis of lysosome-related organelles complex 1 [Rhizophagus irregularis DAOM 181602=DAOM 197198]|uniref:Biogenesis of lysosome-related organelles complex 1 subunit 1 n=1 Tax=Rhizophagus irregularis (strain DAOM 181602 / DAOM 197198 / MUCL 43194) TaxID=747089 RepID=U9TTB6_RHIID|nr:biogenesis of lysosome-related organelles complex 1 [Rhizophagus irregularis DAOM 181602=DAOM 197198]POG62045.1 biogenesis of lysosome-related organelles complex 1 [Rhizophagus irregularis DAOM 181602=DAOM 197198]|eukprot:XP_025168911.1 biogenesis of lysosome-related organelles complex 1 [Rhizophagus irregularis DAOM 181602=DAOM 197198]